MNKIVILISLFLFTIYGCNKTKQNYIEPTQENQYDFDTTQEIGKNFFDLNQDMDVLSGYKHINGISYKAIAFCFDNIIENKILVYVLNNEYIVIECYLANFINYKKIKNIPKRTHYKDIIQKLGEPVFTIYDDPMLFSDSFSFHYFQREINSLDNNRGKYTISLRSVGFSFNNNGELVSIREYKTTNLWD